MFKFVDEESDDYFKNVKDVEYMGGDGEDAGMSNGMKIGLGVGLLAVVGLVVFFATKGGAEDATATDADATAEGTETTPAEGTETTPADGTETTPASEWSFIGLLPNLS